MAIDYTLANFGFAAVAVTPEVHVSIPTSKWFGR